MNDWLWQSYSEPAVSGVHGCLYKVLSLGVGDVAKGSCFECTSLSVRSNYVFHANSGSSRKVSTKVKATIYTIPDNLLLVNHLIWCGYCCRPDTQCKLAPWAKCKGAKVNINRQALELLMKEECPEFMDVQLSETVCYSEAKCGVCAESLAGKVM